MKVAQHKVLGSRLRHHQKSRSDDRTHPPRASEETPTNSTPNAPPNSNASSARPSPKSTPALTIVQRTDVTKLDAPPLSRSDRVGTITPSTLCHSERSEESLSSPNTLSGAPGSAPQCSALTWGRMNSPHHRGRARLQPCQKTRPKVASSLPQADVAMLTTDDYQTDATRIAHRWNRKDPRSTLRHHTPARRAEHASPARQCWVQNRGKAPSSLPQALLLCAQLTTHDSRHLFAAAMASG